MTSSSSFFLRNVQCKGTETSILTCLNDGWMEDVSGGCNLPGYSVASVKCSGPGKTHLPYIISILTQYMESMIKVYDS